MFHQIIVNQSEQFNFHVRFLIAFLAFKWGEYIVAAFVLPLVMVMVVGGGYWTFFADTFSWQQLVGLIAFSIGVSVLWSAND